MGVKGPIPKRSTEGHRTTQARKLDGGVEPVNVVAEQVKPPKPDPDWHPIAKKLWKAVEQSTFTRYYEPSDWIVLYSTCDDLSNYKMQDRRSPTMLAAVNTMLTSLLLTEGIGVACRSRSTAWTSLRLSLLAWLLSRLGRRRGLRSDRDAPRAPGANRHAPPRAT